MKFEWDPPKDSGGSIISKYEVWYKRINQDETAWAKLVDRTNLQLEYEHTGLTGTEDTQYKIKAISNDRGDGVFGLRGTFILSSTPTTSSAPTKLTSARDEITV